MHPLPLSNVLRRVRSNVAAREMRGLPDAELLGRFVAERDEAAFSVLMHRHSSMVLGVCRRVVAHVQDAEDACQATFLILARKASSIRKTESLGSWLHGVAYRISLRLKSQAARQPRSNSSVGDSAQRDTTSAVTWQEAMQLLDEELDRLPAPYRAPLVLCYLEGQTLDEAARQLGWTLGTFRGRLERGREMLRKRLTRRGVEIPIVLFGLGLSSSLAGATAPPTLAAATVKAAILIADGQAATTGLISAKVAALMEGMIMTKLKTATALLLVAAVVMAAGISLGLGFTLPTAAEPPAPNHTALTPIVAANNSNPPGPRGDEFGDPLPANAVARLGTERFRTDAWVDQIAVVPGRKQLLAQGAKAVILFEAATGREIRRFEPPRWRKADQGGVSYSVQIESFAISPDGKLLAAGTRDTSKLDCPILLFDFASGRKLAELPGHKSGGWSANRSLVFATSTRLLSAGADNTVRVWDVTTHQEVNRLEMPAESSVSGLAVSPDGKQVFGAGSDQKSSFWAIWDLGTGKLLHREGKLPGRFARLALSPDAQTVAISVGVGEVQQVGGSNEVHIYSVADRKELRRWKTHDGQFPQRNDVAFAPDGRTITTGGADQKVRSWDVATGKEIGSAIEPYEYANNISYLDATTLITFGAQHAVKFWDLATGRPKLEFAGSESHLTAVAYSPDGRHVATGGGGGDSTIRVWDATTGKQVAHLRAGVLFDVTSLKFSPDGKRVVSGESGGTARLWEWASGKEIRAFPDHKPWLHSVAFSPDGRNLATGDDAGVVRVWDVTGKKPIYALGGHTAHVTSLVFSPDGRTLFSGSWDHNIRQWDLAIGKEVRVIKGVQAAMEQAKPVGHTNVVTDLALSADGRRLFSGSYDHTICVWEVSSGQLCRLLKGQSRTSNSSVHAIALSPDGKQLAAAIEDGVEEGRVHVWDVLTGEKIGALAGHRGKVTRLAYAPNGGRLVSCSVDTTAMVWDVTGLNGRRLKLDAEAAADFWKDLADPDTEKGYSAVCRLVAAGDTTVDILRRKLTRATPPDVSKASALIKHLDDSDFRKREQADQSLKALGLSIEPLIRKAIANAATLEVKRRLEKILAEFTAEMLRQDRTLEVLEMIGTANARTTLADLAKGDPEARLTRSVNDAIRRLNRTLAKPRGGS